MQNTACGCDCPFVKQGFCNSDKECPNYMETWWTEGVSQETKLVKDCSPKRVLLQNQQMENRLIEMQNTLHVSKQEYEKLSGYLMNLIEISKTISFEQPKLIQNKDSHEVNICLLTDVSNT